MIHKDVVNGPLPPTPHLVHRSQQRGLRYDYETSPEVVLRQTLLLSD